MTEIVLHGARVEARRRPRLGYAMVTAAAMLFAVNGTVSKVILTQSEMSTLRLTELRAMQAKKNNAAVDEVQAVADRFNEQLRIFKARDKQD